ncbi:hypothetical protein [Sulfuricurvum sp.]|uniref:hypothetical protein n=1 Tax=Sulfuricurvum sp. TaxID=2025608 RepID=UPI003561C793
MTTILKATADKNPRGGYSCIMTCTFDGINQCNTHFGEHSIASFLYEVFQARSGKIPVVNDIFINGKKIPHYELKKMMLRKLATARKTGRGSEHFPEVAIIGIDAQYQLTKSA